MGLELVADRICGECTACCVNLKIETDQFKKPADVHCPHLCSAGCGIYETRPSVCRTWYCGWRYMGQLGLEMRPDKSGILLRVQDGPSIVLQPTGGLEVLLAMPAMELLGSLVSSDIATYISMPGKPGYTNVMLHLNPALAAPVHARDLVGVAQAIVSALEFGSRTPTDPL
jgi:hypothetical protein